MTIVGLYGAGKENVLAHRFAYLGIITRFGGIETEAESSARKANLEQSQKSVWVDTLSMHSPRGPIKSKGLNL